MTTPMGRRLLVMERGSGGLASRAHDGFEETVVIAQLPDESELEFARRVLCRLALAERSQRTFDAAQLVPNPRLPGSRTARTLLGIALANHVRRPEQGSFARRGRGARQTRQAR